MRQFPKLKIAYSEGQIGWIPYALERADTVWEEHNAWLHSKRIIPEPPSTYYYDRVFGCFTWDRHGVRSLDEVGENNICFETDYPHTDTTWPNSKAYCEQMLAGVPRRAGVQDPARQRDPDARARPRLTFTWRRVTLGCERLRPSSIPPRAPRRLAMRRNRSRGSRRSASRSSRTQPRGARCRAYPKTPSTQCELRDLALLERRAISRPRSRSSPSPARLRAAVGAPPSKPFAPSLGRVDRGQIAVDGRRQGPALDQCTFVRRTELARPRSPGCCRSLRRSARGSVSMSAPRPPSQSVARGYPPGSVINRKPTQLHPSVCGSHKAVRLSDRARYTSVNRRIYRDSFATRAAPIGRPAPPRSRGQTPTSHSFGSM